MLESKYASTWDRLDPVKKKETSKTVQLHFESVRAINSFETMLGNVAEAYGKNEMRRKS